MRHQPQPHPRQGLRHRTDLNGRRHLPGGAVCRPRPGRLHAASVDERGRSGRRLVQRRGMAAWAAISPGPCCATGSTSYAVTTGTCRSGSTRPPAGAARPAGPARRADPSRPSPARGVREPRRRAGRRRLGRRRGRVAAEPRAHAGSGGVDGRRHARGPRGPGLRRRRTRAVTGREHPRWWSPSASRGAGSPTRWSATTSATSGWPCSPARCGSARSSSPDAPPASAASTHTSATSIRVGRRCSISSRSCRRHRRRDPDPCLVQLGGRLGGRATSYAGSTAATPPSGRPPSPSTDDLEVTRRDWLRHPHCGCAWG